MYTAAKCCICSLKTVGKPPPPSPSPRQCHKNQRYRDAEWNAGSVEMQCTAECKLSSLPPPVLGAFGSVEVDVGGKLTINIHELNGDVIYSKDFKDPSSDSVSMSSTPSANLRPDGSGSEASEPSSNELNDESGVCGTIGCSQILEHSAVSRSYRFAVLGIMSLLYTTVHICGV